MPHVRSTLTHMIRLALLALPLSAPLAFAQDSAEQDAALRLDDVQVTARKVVESVQKVPVPVTAFTEAQIEASGAESLADIAKQTPGFSFRQGFGREGDRPVIRGQSNIQGNPNAAFFIDGIFVRGNISGFGLDNLERVEVIRGPQSAQYGRQTFSGAINYVTRRPTNEARGNVTLRLATDSEYEMSANMSGAIVDDKLNFSLNMRHFQFGGQYFNSASGRTDLGGQKSNSFGGALYFKPNESLDIIGRMYYGEDRDEHYAIARLGGDGRLSPNNCFLPGASVGTNVDGRAIRPDRRRGYFCGTTEVPDAFGISTAAFEAAGWRPGLARDNFRSSVTMNYTAPNDWVLSSITAFNHVRSLSVVDQDFSTARTGAFETIDRGATEDFSQELRITTDPTQRLRGSAGLYFYKEELRPGSFTGDLTGCTAARPGLSCVTYSNAIANVSNQAVFGMVEYALTDQWTLTAEGRYAQDDIEAAGLSTFTSFVTGRPVVFPSRFFSLNNTFDSFTPRVTLAYQMTDDVNFYALAAKGNKPGGFNTSVQAAQLTEAARAELINAGLGSFDEETAWTYELGMKADWFDNRLRTNASIFRINWDKQQLTDSRLSQRVDGTSFLNSYTTNLGESRVNGLELDANWLITENLEARLAYTYLDAEIVDFFSPDQADLFWRPEAIPAGSTADVIAAINARNLAAYRAAGQTAGNRLPRVPEHQLSASGTYDWTLDNGWGMYFRSDINYEGSRFDQVHNLAETGSSTVVNFRLGANIDEHWALTAYVTNAFDEDAVEDILRYVDPVAQFATLQQLRVPNQPPLTGFANLAPRDFVVTPQRERQFGVSATYRF
jgi:iron complex outermembrane recepter protein